MRLRGERALRVTAWAALALTAWIAWRGPVRPSVRAVEGNPSIETVAAWAANPPSDTLVVAFRGLPADTVRARVAAMRGAGVLVRWRDAGVPSLAAEVELDVVTGRGIVATTEPTEASDGAGPVGTVDGALTVPGLVLPVWAGVRPSVERIAVRRAVVLGAPAWESRWVARALEASGWEVEVGLQIAPDQATAVPVLDSMVGVVLVLDRVAPAVARALERYIRAGGGAVLAPGALASPVLAGIAPGAVGPAERPPASLALPAARADLAFQPVVRLVPGAVSLEAGRIAARVEGEGRVVLVGEVETWRWALASDAGREAHAAFWTRVAGAARSRPSSTRVPGDPAPRAALVAAFGLPSEMPVPRVPGLPWEAMAFGVTIVLLVTEWGIRRLRGAA